MIKDYHIHPQIIKEDTIFCEFAEEALEKGVQEVCITDHMPLVGSAAGDRIPMGMIEKYCEKARQIADSCKEKLSVKVGIEIDFHPSVIDQIEEVLKAGDFDYILGSSHLHVIPNIFCHCRTRNAYARAMFENIKLAAESGYFTAIAHPDMYQWVFTRPDRFPLEDDGFCEEKHMERIDSALAAIKKNNLRLEINPHLAVAMNNIEKVYPSAAITELALQKGIRFSYGSDAHIPQDVGAMLPELRRHSIYKKALATWEENR